MTKELESKISELVTNWNSYKIASDELVKEDCAEYVEGCLDDAMSQYLKDTNSRGCETYQYIMNEMPNSEGRQSLRSICRIGDIIGTDEFRATYGWCAIDENYYDYIEKKIAKLKTRNEIMEESK